ncbi:MAG: NAD(+) synthase [Endomicrobium sp.]|jgi:NAD+ synthase (glutamine-hydrolysing)|nr:NAD(+) synthase [Endomicrobium sp.]
MKFGFVKVAAATPQVNIADPLANSKEIIELIEQASSCNVEVLVFPELCLTGYTCGELFLSDVSINTVDKFLYNICKTTIGKKTLVFVGSPIWINSKLYSCAVVLQNGKVLGVVPKTYLPAYSEFYESRYFTSGENVSNEINICGQNCFFGTDIIFEAKNTDSLKIGVEICEDMFVAIAPSCKHAKAGATVIVNLSASNELIGKSDYRKTLIKAQSGRLSCGYVYASAGSGESVSDILFSGHRIIAENGNIIKESPLFETGLTISEIDTQKLEYEHRKLNVFKTNVTGYKIVKFDFDVTSIDLTRNISPLPFIPDDCKSLSKRAELILQMQSQALAQRLAFTSLNAVIGVSGGLDSALALLVVLRSYGILKRDLKDIIAITMPGPGTSIKTLKNVRDISKTLGIKIREISITDVLNKHLKDIKHNGSKNITYENAQARERMQILMDIANNESGLVIGTGDLSENALGWCTYNGDHISMYAVNGSIPKTLVKYLVSYEAQRVKEYKEVLTNILNTEISPELLPSKNGRSLQKTESIVGPYELCDFFLYYTVRFGQSPDKTLFLGYKAFEGKYSKKEIKKYLINFIKRFFANQFKRNCMPDGVKVGTVSLSPRGDWRMPTEACKEQWLKSLND